MAHYVRLLNFTDQGIQTVKDMPQRAQQYSQLAEQMGGHVQTVLLTMGRYDLVVIVEAPDDETASAIALRIGQEGIVRSETLRGFTPEEMRGILAKI